MKAILALGLSLTLGFFNAVQCGVTVCSFSQFSCTSKKCISYKLECNGVDDCGDNSDELNCECSNNQHKCDSSKCISWRDVCDKIADCEDKSDEQFCSCGQSQGSSQDPSVVGGGTVSDSANWPWMAAIIGVSSDGTSSIQCGGTLISELHVLTAAHCFDPKFTELTINDLKVRLAENDFLTTDDSQHLDFSIAEVRMHEQFNKNNLVNDIAIIRLSKRTEFSKLISKSCLLPENVDLTGKNGYLLGWGRKFYQAGVSSKLQIARIPVWNQTSCIEIHQNLPNNSVVSDDMMCAADKEEIKNSCEGDSGGPLMVKLETGASWYVAGIVSWNIRCGLLGHPSVFTRVNHYLQWIADNTKFLGCTSSEFECKSSPKQCIPEPSLCDGKNDCFDNSDEEKCNPCLGFNKENAQCTALGHESRRCTCNEGFYPIEGDPCKGCADPCIGIRLFNAVCEPLDGTRTKCSCNTGFHPIRGDACNGCDDPCQHYPFQNATCSAIDAETPDCNCKNDFLPIAGDPCNDCTDPCNNFKSRNNVCVAVSYNTQKCRCNQGYFPLFEEVPCDGCLNPCDSFRVRNAICTPKTSTSFSCECEERFFPIHDNDACHGCKIVCSSHLGYKEYPTFGCLKAHKVNETWETARKTCQSEGGDLFSPGDSLPILPKEELNLLPYVDYWILVRRTSTKGSPFKRLSDGSLLPDDSPLWDKGNRQPSRKDKEECVRYYSSFENLSDFYCDYNNLFICQLFI